MSFDSHKEESAHHGESPLAEALAESLGEIKELVLQNNKLGGEILRLTQDVARLTTALSNTIGLAASRAMLASWESDVAAALSLTVEGRLPGGEFGAIAVTSQHGEALVLKVFPSDFDARIRRAITIVDRMRDRGVPVPTPYMVGTVGQNSYCLQQRCAGEPPKVLKDVHAARLLELWECHLGACPEGGNWPDCVVSAVTVGTAELWAEHEPIRQSGGSAALLLDEIIELGRMVDPASLTATDAVHGDWHHRNVLAVDDAVTTVIDWEAARPGDARYDLAVLAFWAQVYKGTEVDSGAAQRIGRFAQERIPAEVRAAYAGLIGTHQLWFTATRRPELLSAMVDKVDRHLAPWWRHP